MNRDTRIELLQATRDGLIAEGIAVLVGLLVVAVAVNCTGIFGFVTWP